MVNHEPDMGTIVSTKPHLFVLLNMFINIDDNKGK